MVQLMYFWLIWSFDNIQKVGWYSAANCQISVRNVNYSGADCQEIFYSKYVILEFSLLNLILTMWAYLQKDSVSQCWKLKKFYCHGPNWCILVFDCRSFWLTDKKSSVLVQSGTKSHHLTDQDTTKTNPTVPTVSKHLVTVGRKNSAFTGTHLRQDQEPTQSICWDQLGWQEGWETEISTQFEPHLILQIMANEHFQIWSSLTL